MGEVILRITSKLVVLIQRFTNKMEAIMGVLIAIGLFYGMIKIFTWIFDRLEDSGIVRSTGPTLSSMGRDDIEEMIRRATRK